jgi:hypothetical protein
MFDGQENFELTTNSTTLLNEITELTFHWLLYEALEGETSLTAHIKEYYGVTLQD